MAETIALAGSFNLDSIARIRRDVNGRVKAADTVIDLSAVNEVDSAAVSVLLHWQRDAQAAGHKLSIVSPPAGLVSLARLYGVEEFLAFQ